MSDLPTYVLERSFTAPRELVWHAWTDEKLFARWYGPNVETVIHRQDLRTGGECRISNFLIWQIAYSELVFMDVLWPDFRPNHLYKAVYEFQRRERRFGGI